MRQVRGRPGGPLGGQGPGPGTRPALPPLLLILAGLAGLAGQTSRFVGERGNSHRDPRATTIPQDEASAFGCLRTQDPSRSPPGRPGSLAGQVEGNVYRHEALRRTFRTSPTALMLPRNI